MNEVENRIIIFDVRKVGRCEAKQSIHNNMRLIHIYIYKRMYLSVSYVNVSSYINAYLLAKLKSIKNW